MILMRVLFQRLLASEPRGFAPHDEDLTREERYRRWIEAYDAEPDVTPPLGAGETPIEAWLIGPGGAALEATRNALLEQRGVCVSIRHVGDGRAQTVPIATALAELPGDAYVVLLQAGDQPRSTFLAELAAAFGAAAYADDDVRKADGERTDPAFKPCYAPLRLRGQDYIGSGLLVSAERLTAQPWVSEALSTAADAAEMIWAFNLAATAGLLEAEVRHVPRMLLHRAPNGDEAPRSEPAQAIATHADADRAAWIARRGVRTPAAAGRKPRVSLIVPTRDRLDVLRPCLEGLRKARWDDLEILIVNNGSAKRETRAFLEAATVADRRVRVLSCPGPFNYSALNNAAVRASTGQVLGLINNDIEVTDRDWLAHMVELAMMPQHGAVGARLLYPDGTLQHGGVVLSPIGPALHRLPRTAPGNLGPRDVLRVPQEVGAVTAACLVLRREVFAEVDGLDEEAFAIAFNDIDLCLKVRAAGYRVVWTPHAALVHHESVSRGGDMTGASAVRIRREAEALRARWLPLRDPYYNPNLDPARADYGERP